MKDIGRYLKRTASAYYNDVDMDHHAQRQQAAGLALIALIILLFIVLRHIWSAR